MKLDSLAKKIREELLEKIEETMIKNDLSQAEIARRVGVIRNNLNAVLQRKKTTSVDYLLAVAEAVGLDAELRIKSLKR